MPTMKFEVSPFSLRLVRRNTFRRPEAGGTQLSELTYAFKAKCTGEGRRYFASANVQDEGEIPGNINNTN